MANSMGSLYVGASGLRSSQNALNTTSNNLANVDTKGYVRQQVLFQDSNYITFSTTASISKQQSGLGVSIADVVHARDIFLDKTYRSEKGRSSYYSTTSESLSEMETYFQEMQGEAFQDVLTGDNGIWVAFQELAKSPADSVNQNLVIQKASLLLSRAQSVYSGLKNYQSDLNSQVSDQIDKINDLAVTIDKLNKQIQKIEAGGTESANDLRDQRDSALDELSSYGNISYKELVNGIVTVSFENVPIVDDQQTYSIGKKVDGTTGFITPYWEALSDTSSGKYQYVFDFSKEISTANKNDSGSLRALVLTRGDGYGSYTDMASQTSDSYSTKLGNSAIKNVEAQLDTLMHSIVTSINNLLCPNKTSTAAITGTDANGNAVTIPAGSKILDTANCTVGSDGSLPPQELFTRTGTDRYTKVTASDGTEYYVYNEEDPSDTSKQYTMDSLSINAKLLEQESLLPTINQDGSVAQKLGESLANLWDQATLTVDPTSNTKLTFGEYYNAMISSMSSKGNVAGSTATNLSSSVTTINNARQQVIGVSSDEELTNMIKYQNAYNAASRYINVVSEMLETLISQMG